MAKDRVGKPCCGSPIYSTGLRDGAGSGCRPALVAAASPESLTPPRVHDILVLDLLVALAGSGRGGAAVGGASASQARSWSSRGGGWGRRGGLYCLIQGGALRQMVQAGAGAAWRKKQERGS